MSQVIKAATRTDVCRNTDIHVLTGRNAHARLPTRGHNGVDTGLSDMGPGSATNQREVSDGRDSNDNDDSSQPLLSVSLSNSILRIL